MVRAPAAPASRTSSSEINNLSGDPSMLQIYFAGSKTTPTSVNFDNQHQMALTVYAPDSNVNLSNSTSIVGGIIAKKVTMRNSAKRHLGFQGRHLQRGEHSTASDLHAPVLDRVRRDSSLRFQPRLGLLTTPLARALRPRAAGRAVRRPTSVQI